MELAYVTLPVFMILIISTASHLEDVAKSTSSKALAFSDEMNKAMDCATRGIPLKECAPDMVAPDLSSEKEAFLEEMVALQEAIQAAEENVSSGDENENATETVAVATTI